MYKAATPAQPRSKGLTTARRRSIHVAREASAQPGPPWARLLQHWPGVLFRQRADLSFEYISPQVQEFTGLSPQEFQGDAEAFWKVVHEADAEGVRGRMQHGSRSPTGRASSFRIRNARTGRVTYLAEFRQPVVDDQGHLIGYEGFWQDITRQTVSERRLAAAAWKETLGVLTMGLAHDFNNMIAGIHSLSDSFLRQIDSNHPFHEGLELIRRNAESASQLVHRIVNLHRGRTGDRGYHDLNGIVADTSDLLQKIVPKRIALSVRLADRPLPLYVDAVELRQIMINLALNAVDAMPAQGTLRFETSFHDEVPAFENHHGRVGRLPAACLSIADTGCGIKPYHLPSIFDPFFTTKTRNKGCGLGLYNARVFVEQHDGAISVDSAEGLGTTFRVWLPVSNLTEADPTPVSPGRRRNLLVAGTETRTCQSIAEFWRQQGYQVVVGCPDLLDQLQSAEHQFDGVLLLAEPHSTSWRPLFEFIRRERLPWRTILQVIGRNQDEMDTRMLVNADLVISEDMPEAELVKRMDALWRSPVRSSA
ncbi:MAG TPA: ATP-binding protein [Methylomirabilota bacterium]|nr:ATP-binding protein [Methylomirabilota bacterium]